ncbi:hypothetical protein QBC32DRAFT_138211 [Pseudoneurospora amorphoporcata]|uniref:Uncharacterized protein n=1 Tax=Pseudoneurospora amorphoporcata TaxID=241081 RepID=A0AAN6P2C7_9PEZI|nr:hypothetical protein QBC32DRAFT_138211 [Pseudoneurospora amorphoporcata]
MMWRLPPSLGADCHHFPNSRGLRSIHPSKGQGHRGIMGTKSGASASGPGQPTTGGEARWRTGHQATCPPPWNQTRLPAKRQSAGWSMMTSPKHGMVANSAIHCCKGTCGGSSRPEIGTQDVWTGRDDGVASLRTRWSRSDAHVLAVCRERVAVFCVVGVQNAHGGTGPGMPAGGVVGDGAQLFREADEVDGSWRKDGDDHHLADKRWGPVTSQAICAIQRPCRACCWVVGCFDAEIDDAFDGQTINLIWKKLQP